MASQTTVWAQTMLGQTLKAQYRLRGILGEGAMGVVFSGVNLAMDKSVAIKMMRKETYDTPDALERFNREARVWSQLNHPAITQVFDFGLHEDQPFLVMELVEGVDVSDMLKREGQLEPLRAVKLMRQLAAALEEAHRLGVVHRDIKPQNMKLLRYQPGGKMLLKVLDFGMAKQVGRADQRLTAPGILVGTPKYVAPEQVTENPVLDGRTDLYAAGVVFYELLTGNAPFLGSPHEVLFAHLGTEPKPLPDTVPMVVQEVVMRLLRKRPDDRFANAAALDAALEECETLLRVGTAPSLSSGHYAGGMSGANFVPVSPSARSGPVAIGMPSSQSLRGVAAAMVPAAQGTPSSRSTRPATPSSQSARPVSSGTSSQPSGPLPVPSSQPKGSSTHSGRAATAPAQAASSARVTPQHTSGSGATRDSQPPSSTSMPSSPGQQRHSGSNQSVPVKSGAVRFLVATFLILLVAAGAGLFYGLRHYLPLQRVAAEWVPTYKVPQDEVVEQSLHSLESARDVRNWAEVLRGVQFLEQRYGATLLPEQTTALNALRQKAQLEQPLQEIFEKLVAASVRTDHDEVVRLHDQLSSESVYRSLAQPYYDSAVESYVSTHLSKAEELRLAGHCADYLTEIQKMLNVVPGHPQARAAERKECPPPASELGPAIVAPAPAAPEAPAESPDKSTQGKAGGLRPQVLPAPPAPTE